MCSPPSRWCTLPLKSLCLGLQQEFLSQPFHKKEKVSTQLSKESTRTIHSSSHTLVIFLPQSPPAEVSLGFAYSRGGRAVVRVHPGRSPALHSCSSVQSTLPKQIPLFPHPNPRTSCSAADSRRERVVEVRNATGTLSREICSIRNQFKRPELPPKADIDVFRTWFPGLYLTAFSRKTLRSRMVVCSSTLHSLQSYGDIFNLKHH